MAAHITLVCLVYLNFEVVEPFMRRVTLVAGLVTLVFSNLIVGFDFAKFFQKLI